VQLVIGCDRERIRVLFALATFDTMPDMATQASTFFEQIRDSGDDGARAAFLRKLVADNKPENEFLDYKGGKIQEQENNLKSQWSKALSGFANTGGGVLIFGIDSRKQKGAVVESNQLALVEKPDELVQRLKDFHIQATDEVVTLGEPLVIKEADGKGFVVYLIPEGTRKPYRAMLDGEVYYMRVIDKMVKMPHSHLRTMFYPRSSACIDASLELRILDLAQYSFVLYIENTGTATASDIVLQLESNRIMTATPHGTFSKYSDQKTVHPAEA